MPEWSVTCLDTIRNAEWDLPRAPRLIMFSPPYPPLRCYDEGADGAIGTDSDLSAYTDAIRGLLLNVKKALADDGHLVLNIGDSYCGKGDRRKSLNLLPERIAMELDTVGFIIRNRVIWAKQVWLADDTTRGATIPHGTKDRWLPSHEMCYLCTPKAMAYFDTEAVKIPKATQETRDPLPKEEWDALFEKKMAAAQKIYGDDPGQRLRIKTLRRMPPLEGRPIRSVKTGPDVWQGPVARNDFHPAEYPPWLCRRFIKSCTEPGDLVVDPMCGSSSLGVTALRLGRDYCGFDISESYVDASIQRITAQEAARESV